MNSYLSLVGSSIHSNWRWLEADWSELSSCWLSWTWVWLINEDKLGFPWTEMLDFFVFVFSLSPRCSQTVSHWWKKNLCFWETQTLSSVFSIRTLKIIKQPCNAMSHEDSYFGGVYLERMPDAYFYFFSLISSSVCLLSSCVSPSCGWPYLILWDVQPAFGVHLTLCVYTFILRLF